MAQRDSESPHTQQGEQGEDTRRPPESSFLADNGEDEVRSRLRTHLVYFPHLQVGPYAALNETDRKQRVSDDYARFCQSRANLLHAAAVHVASGKLLTADSISAAWEQVTAETAQTVPV